MPESAHIRPFPIRLGVASEYEEWLDRTASPFVPAATAIATVIGEDLRIDAAVSPRLAAGAARASGMYAGWWGYRPADIDAVGADHGGVRGSGGAVLYSRGVDSTSAVLRSLDGVIPERVTHLLSAHGINPHYSSRTEESVWRETEQAAADYGLPLVRLHTNVSSVLRERMGWTRAFGAIFASAALAIGPLLRDVLFGGTVDDAYPRPRGSHPELDPLWSTERTAFRQDGTELGKFGRTGVVARSPVALRHLKVCWLADTPGNCGRCGKCLRTMTALASWGALDRTEAFDAPLTVEAILACDMRLSHVVHVRQLVDRMPPELAELRAAWQERLRELQEEGPRRSWAARRARGMRRGARRIGRGGGRIRRRARTARRRMRKRVRGMVRRARAARLR